MKSKTFKRTVSVLLALLLALGGFDVWPALRRVVMPGGDDAALHHQRRAAKAQQASPVSATPKHGTDGGGGTPYPVEDFLKAMAEVNKELATERTQNSKTFIDGKGNRSQLIFADRIHFKDPHGRWQDIDNSIARLNAAEHPRLKSAGAAATRGFGYTNSANDYNVLFSGDGTPRVSFRYGDTALDLSVKGANQSTAIVDANAVLYPGISEGIDLGYRALNYGLKEDIIINKYTGTVSFTFDIQTDNISLVQEGGVIKAYRKTTGEYLYQLSPPYMMDADGMTNDRVAVKLKPKGGGRGAAHYTLELVPDNAWLRDRRRVYPVRIDPSISIEASHDAYAEEKYPDTLTYPQVHLYIGYDNGDASGNGSNRKGETITYLKFDTPAIPEGAVITSARLNLFKITRWDDAGKTAYLYRITENKPVHTISWDNRPALSGPVSSTVITPAKGTYGWDITGTVEGWVTGDQPNYGLAPVDVK